MPVADGPEDPGWRPALKWWVVVPGPIIRHRRRAGDPGDHGLTVLRRAFVSFTWGVVMIGLTVVLLSATTTTNSHPIAASAVAAGVTVWGIFTVVVPRLVKVQLDCSDDRRLAGSYRTWFFSAWRMPRQLHW